MLVTDPHYRLPRLTALRYNNTLSSGANLPGLVTARDQQTGEAIDCVVKFKGAERMSPKACARELLAIFIARQWGIRVVEPVLVDVSSQFVELARGESHYEMLSKSIGLNFGSVYIPGCQTIPVFQPLNGSELSQAQLITAFDLFIQNNDRRTEKPNVMSDGKDLVIYDHELAFGFAMDVFPNPCPYQLRPQDKIWIDNLFLLDKIKGKPWPVAEITWAIKQLDNNFWDQALAQIPSEWQTEQLTAIRSYLTEIVSNVPNFIKSVKNI